MNEVVDLYQNGEKHKAMILRNFSIEGNDYCMYAVPNGDGTFGIQCGKIEGNEVHDIEDEHERTVINNIIKTVLYNHKKEEFLNMNDEEMKFTITDENGVEKNATFIGIYEVGDHDYSVCAIEETPEKSGLYVKRVVYDEDGEETGLETITDEDERQMVFSAIRAAIDEELEV